MCFRLWEHTYFFYGGKHGTVPILRKGICGQLLSAMRRTQTETKRLSSVQRGAVAANEILPPMRIRISRPQTERGGKTPLLFARAKLQKEIKIPQGITFLAYDAFYGCENLARAVLPESLTYLGKRAFAECASLKSVSLPSALTEIKAQTFLHCVALNEITLPDAIVSIGESAFEGCRALTAAVLPQNLRVLGREAFARCESLTEVTIFPKIAMIGGYAFNGCKRLTDIRFYGTRAQWEGIKKGKNIFSPARPAIHCTDETIEN